MSISQTVKADDFYSISTPVENSIYRTGEYCIIRWDTNKEFFQVDLYLFRNNAQVKTIAKGIVNRRGFQWYITGISKESHYYQIKIVDSDNPSLNDFSDSFTIVFQPSISITNPTPIPTSSWIVLNSYRISWISQGLISHVDIELYKDSKYLENIANHIQNEDSHFWTIPNDIKESNLYRIVIRDSNDTNVYGISNYFTIKNSSNDEKPDDNDDDSDDDNNNIPNNSKTILVYNIIILISIFVSVFILIFIMKKNMDVYNRYL